MLRNLLCMRGGLSWFFEMSEGLRVELKIGINEYLFRVLERQFLKSFLGVSKQRRCMP